MSKTIITIQPKMRKNKTLPYPYFIDAKDGKVGRQDFWKGEPWKLIGFDINQKDHGESGKSITLKQFLADPKLCIGMYPIFANKSDQFYTYADPIASFKIDNSKDREELAKAQVEESNRKKK